MLLRPRRRRAGQKQRASCRKKTMTIIGGRYGQNGDERAKRPPTRDATPNRFNCKRLHPFHSPEAQTSTYVLVKVDAADMAQGGFHIRRPQWVGEGGSPKEQNQLICDSDMGGGKKSEHFADVIYGSPPPCSQITLKIIIIT